MKSKTKNNSTTHYIVRPLLGEATVGLGEATVGLGESGAKHRIHKSNHLGSNSLFFIYSYNK